jgi:hypothetical protein
MHDGDLRHELEIEVALELGMARSSDKPGAAGEWPSEWLFDPGDVDREEVGLRNIQGALEALENGPQ